MNTDLQKPSADMASVLMKLHDLGAKPLATLTVEQARSQPTPADAVNAVLTDQGKNPAALKAAMNISIADKTYPTAGTTQPIRLYTPHGPAPEAGYPVIVYFHGGGFVIANIATYESSAMAMAQKTHAIVASVEYRHAPEHKFPAAHEDAIAAYKWVLANAHAWQGDAHRVAVMGESAGANLAANVAIAARDQGLQAPVYMALVYPVAGNDINTPSYQQNTKSAPLSKADMMWFFEKVVFGPKDKMSAMLNLVGNDTLRNLPNATIIAAEIDPLLSEGKTLSDKLTASGSHVNYQHYKGVTHEFFGMDAVVMAAGQAQNIVAGDLKSAFAGQMAIKTSATH